MASDTPARVIAAMSLERGIELFNRGLYWEAHEAWEEAWTPDRHGPDRGFYKGLIQVAAAACTTAGATGTGPSASGEGAPATCGPTCPGTTASSWRRWWRPWTDSWRRWSARRGRR